ncbi:uncharacterized protein LOC103517470 [Diaphorina citri]|uniref:Uncharacterized protein LOC103517470 n=1 Tax=Diaphorina citri TaxID=121845 RepID=A0A1S3DFK6_DIACI|nr:uncharacterized protein LOC103517470 [Diaphorina citri]
MEQVKYETRDDYQRPINTRRTEWDKGCSRVQPLKITWSSQQCGPNLKPGVTVMDSHTIFIKDQQDKIRANECLLRNPADLDKHVYAMCSKNDNVPELLQSCSSEHFNTHNDGFRPRDSLRRNGRFKGGGESYTTFYINAKESDKSHNKAHIAHNDVNYRRADGTHYHRSPEYLLHKDKCDPKICHNKHNDQNYYEEILLKYSNPTHKCVDFKKQERTRRNPSSNERRQTYYDENSTHYYTHQGDQNIDGYLNAEKINTKNEKLKFRHPEKKNSNKLNDKTNREKKNNSGPKDLRPSNGGWNQVYSYYCFDENNTKPTHGVAKSRPSNKFSNLQEESKENYADSWGREEENIFENIQNNIHNDHKRYICRKSEQEEDSDSKIEKELASTSSFNKDINDPKIIQIAKLIVECFQNDPQFPNKNNTKQRANKGGVTRTNIQQKRRDHGNSNEVSNVIKAEDVLFVNDTFNEEEESSDFANIQQANNKIPVKPKIAALQGRGFSKKCLQRTTVKKKASKMMKKQNSKVTSLRRLGSKKYHCKQPVCYGQKRKQNQCVAMKNNANRKVREVSVRLENQLPLYDENSHLLGFLKEGTQIVGPACPQSCDDHLYKKVPNVKDCSGCQFSICNKATQLKDDTCTPPSARWTYGPNFTSSIRHELVKAKFNKCPKCKRCTQRVIRTESPTVIMSEL